MKTSPSRRLPCVEDSVVDLNVEGAAEVAAVETPEVKEAPGVSAVVRADVVCTAEVRPCVAVVPTVFALVVGSCVTE
jgi:hypothetical protein